MKKCLTSFNILTFWILNCLALCLTGIGANQRQHTRTEIKHKVAQLFNISGSASSKAVYYVKAEELPGFCCGYNALFNACNIEAAFGKSQKYSDRKIFAKTCRQHLKNWQIHPLDVVYNDELEELAKNLGIQNFYCVSYEPHSVFYIPDFPLPSKDARFHNNIKKKLDASTGLFFVHFVCHLPYEEGHWILMTLVQNTSGRALYIYDNLNLAIDEESQVFIDFFCKSYKISPKGQFQGVQMPAKWPSL